MPPYNTKVPGSDQHAFSCQTDFRDRRCSTPANLYKEQSPPLMVCPGGPVAVATCQALRPINVLLPFSSISSVPLMVVVVGGGLVWLISCMCLGIFVQKVLS